MCPDENNKNFAELFKLHAEGKINPEVSQKYTLENSADAFLHLANRKAKGKVIINMSVSYTHLTLPTKRIV